ncbi:formyltetrahydrofolate deformylase [Croceiramulus getboli]|nr:formyltetrahydrofolate deformylase [Flavobacteriaceae bacterium YJPT1-3]
MTQAIILIHCPDRKGLVAAITTFVKEAQANIIYLDQHVDRETDTFFMRLVCAFDTATELIRFRESFQTKMANPYDLSWQLFDHNETSRIALLVSKYDHCLYDLLGRHATGELRGAISLIISNHPDLSGVAKQFDIPFFHIPVNKETKKEAETKQLELLQKHEIDLIVLARYMQIISADFVAHYPNKIINIHHSFLPAFVGAKPYHAAFDRGVKIIGATSHYVTSDLDEGPIIEQETVRVSHIHGVQDFIMKGRDLEKIVLARAVKAHLDHKILVYGNKTIIFS